MKKSIIEAIYYEANIRSDSLRMNKEQFEYADKCCELYDKLLASLNDKQKKLFEEFVDCDENEMCIIAKRNFVEGFKLGLLIGIESMDDFPVGEN